MTAKPHNYIHGQSRYGQETGEYIVWKSMKTRCNNKNSTSYANYGGRGIRVCDLWCNDFLAFLRDVGPRPTPQHSLDRIDNDRDYEPGNVRWVTRAEQSRNTRRNHIVQIDGQEMTLTDAAHLHNTTYERVSGRLRDGWSLERALSEPVKARSKFPGVEFVPTGNKKPYRARRVIDGVRVPLGFYATAEEAHAAYLKAVQPRGK